MRDHFSVELTGSVQVGMASPGPITRAMVVEAVGAREPISVCIATRGVGVWVNLDAASARRLAEKILATLPPVDPS